MSKISRRDFLKLAGVTAATALASRPLLLRQKADSDRPNIIIILCDSFSARHLSLYGYPRKTTPYMDAFAERATVYHKHYSGGNFTTTATASMLTGMIPWKHRALNLGGLVRSEFVSTNPYTLLGSEYQRFSFSQNPFPDRLMGQYHKDIDRFLPPTSYSLQKDVPLLRLFDDDRALSSLTIEDFLLSIQDDTVSGSALFGSMNKVRNLLNSDNQKIAYRNGLPEILDSWSLISYLNEEVYAGIHSEISRLASGSAPYFAYFHLYSPHFPYRPRNSFQKMFQDD